MLSRISAAVVAAAVLGTPPAQAQDVEASLNGAERIGLSGRRGPSLLRPGFGVGEYAGFSSSRASSRRSPFGSREMASADFTVTAPAFATPVEASCAGGQSHRQILWITFDRDELSYDCAFSGAAPADARLTLALARGSFLERLQQPQRAGEMTWNGATYRFETRRVGGLPWGGGRVMGYVVSRDGADIGALDLNGLRPTFYLPPQGSPDRDAVAVLTLSLFFFQDPANN